ncbi:hypothetical protein [Streptomyces edwardsiae]|uniref:Uncharacterized protein n=1 Tax=Streptomyces edwardsiae TaxID=3075527 RepID=A0ABU2Q901_9ACTN|nr:hypothetical protein [Streptomyces sp. DSM 41635]MDT0400930.1 hypothetical protein [Streptomyces sp. DSM 41635]
MDSTETARRLLGHDAAGRLYAELTSGYGGHTPIYTALVEEWRARGHTVPEHRDGLWASLAAATAGERATVLPVPFPVPLLGPATGDDSEEVTSPPTPRAPH